MIWMRRRREKERETQSPQLNDKRDFTIALISTIALETWWVDVDMRIGVEFGQVPMPRRLPVSDCMHDTHGHLSSSFQLEFPQALPTLSAERDFTSLRPKSSLIKHLAKRTKSSSINYAAASVCAMRLWAKKSFSLSLHTNFFFISSFFPHIHFSLSSSLAAFSFLTQLALRNIHQISQQV